MKVPYSTLVAIARSAGLDSEAIYPDYSGRGMYGSQCVGFIIDEREDWPNLDGAIWDVLGAADFGTPSWDSMGLRSIAYWPSVKCLDAPAEEDEHEEDEE
jgi:hypothetical protein